MGRGRRYVWDRGGERLKEVRGGGGVGEEHLRVSSEYSRTGQRTRETAVTVVFDWEGELMVEARVRWKCEAEVWRARRTGERSKRCAGSGRE